jgi:hypothetical protein
MIRIMSDRDRFDFRSFAPSFLVFQPRHGYFAAVGPAPEAYASRGVTGLDSCPKSLEENSRVIRIIVFIVN